MKRLTRYIIQELTGPLIFGVIAFSLIIFGTSIMFHILKAAINYNIPITNTLLILLLQFPQSLTVAIPMGMLLSSLLTFSRLNGDLEIITLRSSGISLIELVKPVLIVGLSASLIGILVSEYVIPKSTTLSQTLIAVHQNQGKPTIKKNINLTEYDKGVPKRIINIAKINKGLLQDITVAEFSKGQLIRIVKAQEGSYINNTGWELKRGILHQINPQDLGKLTSIRFKKEKINLQISPFDFSKRNKQIIEMSAKELKEHIKTKKNKGESVIQDLMDFHMKFAISFTSLIFAILGLPIGLKPQRTTSAIGIGITLATILIYYLLLSIGMSLGNAGYANPILATWLPNIIIGILSIFMIRKLLYK